MGLRILLYIDSNKKKFHVIILYLVNIETLLFKKIYESIIIILLLKIPLINHRLLSINIDISKT